MQIPNSLVLTILILASIGLGRVAFWCGRFTRAVWEGLSKKGESYSFVKFKPSDDTDHKHGQ